MPINMVVAVTHQRWFDNLSRKRDLDEVNFWSPSNLGFGSLVHGELFLFKLRAPHNAIAGGGVYIHSTKDMPCSMAWEAFGEANGANSVRELREIVADCNNLDPRSAADPLIGCRVLAEPFFLSEDEWIPVPKSFYKCIVRHKGYGTDEPDGMRLWDQVCDRLARSPGYGQMGLRGKPALINPRLGQGGFRFRLADTYGRRCVVTKERTFPVLEAAHIKPFSEGGSHHPSNGLLLRSDVHKLFDRGYVTVEEKRGELRFLVSQRIREEHGNGKHYYAMDGDPVLSPKNPDWRPNPDALTWHNENCFEKK